MVNAAAESDSVFVTGLPPAIDEAYVKEIFDMYHEVVQCKVLAGPVGAKCAALVRFQSPREAKWIVTSLDGNIPQGLEEPISASFHAPAAAKAAMQNGQTPQTSSKRSYPGEGATNKEAVPSTNLYAEDLPVPMDESRIQEIFGPYGPIVRSRTVWADQRSSAVLVEFSTLEAATSALEGINGAMCDGRRTVVKYASNNKKSRPPPQTVPPPPSTTPPPPPPYTGKGPFGGYGPYSGCGGAYTAGGGAYGNGGCGGASGGGSGGSAGCGSIQKPWMQWQGRSSGQSGKACGGSGGSWGSGGKGDEAEDFEAAENASVMAKQGKSGYGKGDSPDGGKGNDGKSPYAPKEAFDSKGAFQHQKNDHKGGSDSKGGKGGGGYKRGGKGDWSDGKGGDYASMRAFVRNVEKMGALPGGTNYVNDDNCLYVHGLPDDCEDIDLYRLFSPFGGIMPNGVRAMRRQDGSCRGFGFVNFMTTDAAVMAIMTLNGSEMPGGQVLKVETKTDKSQLSLAGTAPTSVSGSPSTSTGPTSSSLLT
eukprot:TRINITY_DN2716_c0_g1_i3.p1 TRINITY_DN2716_c0_g1~~TRINITY_DN2716_c0_g1_i3.p1  ORF type:complete len:551 (+),score=119.84 TRINITY_DN2716_c0_g1_i3:60-1655(+)